MLATLPLLLQRKRSDIFQHFRKKRSRFATPRADRDIWYGHERLTTHDNSATCLLAARRINWDVGPWYFAFTPCHSALITAVTWPQHIVIWLFVGPVLQSGCAGYDIESARSTHFGIPTRVSKWYTVIERAITQCKWERGWHWAILMHYRYARHGLLLLRKFTSRHAAATAKNAIHCHWRRRRYRKFPYTYTHYFSPRWCCALAMDAFRGRDSFRRRRRLSQEHFTICWPVLAIRYGKSCHA